MARAKLIVLIFFPLLLLAGCSALFDFNLFKDLGLDTTTAPSPSDYQGAGGLDKLAEDLSSPAVIDALKNDPAAKAELVTFLEGLITGPVDQPEEQQAAILLADLELKTTNGEELVNNLVTAMMTPIDTSVKVVDLLRSIIPADVAGDRTAFTAMIVGLLSANDMYFALGQSIDGDGDGLVDPGKSLPPGVNAGDIAQKAAVAFLANSIVGVVDLAASGGEAEAIDQMFNLLYAEASLDPLVDPAMTMPDPFSTAGPELNAMKALYDAAGMDLPA
ncbi:MAG: hypothetical protein IMZ69_11645 [Spirochaetes bacterium]|nr:hypothetical protein [Spirochaetota bacterium]